MIRLKSIAILLLSTLCLASEHTRVERLSNFSRQRIPKEMIKKLHQQAAPSSFESVLSSNHIPLFFEQFPTLQSKISYLSLADLPTPVTHLKAFGKRVGTHQLYLKDDGQTGRYHGNKRYIGGNKVRKLEFILADALAHKAQAVVTFGCAGSNHALTTAAYAHLLDLNSFSMLCDQPNSPTVQRNLLLHLQYGSQLIYAKTGTELYTKTAELFQSQKEATGTFPYIIPVGGSMPLGVLGYVNAVFELHKQIEQGIVPEPKIIFVAAGSGGTAAGILLGLQATGLSSKLVAIHIEPESKPHEMRVIIKELFTQTVEFLRELDPQFPQYRFSEDQLEVLREFGGEDYGEPTEEGIKVAQQILDDEGIAFDPTYTAKACAGMCVYIQKHSLSNETLLFWNTFCGEDYTDLTSTVDYRSLPVHFQSYIVPKAQ